MKLGLLPYQVIANAILGDDFLRVIQRPRCHGKRKTEPDAVLTEADIERIARAAAKRARRAKKLGGE